MWRLFILLAAGALSLPAANTYVQHNLVSGSAGQADRADPSLVNPWGIAFTSTGPFWIARQGSGSVGVYNPAGISSTLPVSLLTQPTGIIPSGSSDFIVCSAVGTISLLSGASATTKIDRSAGGAIYTGLASANYAGGFALYAVNFHAGTVEVYDVNFNSLNTSGTFQDPMIPSGFAPYNIWSTGNKLYVTFAQQDGSRSINPLTGTGSGYVDQFDVNGSLVQRVAVGGSLNAPWGLAIAPAKFGDFAGALLVGNYGDGTIDAYDLTTGRSLGVLGNRTGQVLSITSLRALAVGNGTGAGDANTVFFTAGNGGGGPGLFGGLQGPPVISNNGVVNAAGFQLGAAPSTFVTIFGNNLSSTTRAWQTSDFVGGELPRLLNGVGVNVNGVPAYISYISPTQLNVLLPAATGPGFIQITAGGVAGTPVPLQLSTVSPAFFQIGISGFAAATHTDGTLIGPPGMFTSSTRPARVGEVVIIYGNGFGVTNPLAPDGVLVSIPLPLATPPTISIGGSPAQVVYAGLVGPGLYQFNVVVPQVDSGNATVSAQVGETITPSTMIAIQ